MSVIEHPGSGRRASFFGTLKTVLFGALGVRRKADHDRETLPVNPVHLIIAAVVFAALFILTLVVIVRIVTS